MVNFSFIIGLIISIGKKPKFEKVFFFFIAKIWKVHFSFIIVLISFRQFVL